MTSCQRLYNQLGESTKALQRAVTLLKQEKERWKRIHTNPVPDEVQCGYNDDRSTLTITVNIDTGVANAINSQNITRTYTVHAESPKTRILKGPFVVVSGIALSYSAGLRPLIGIGIIDIPYLSKINEELSNIALFGYTTGYSIGGAVGYRFNKDLRLMATVQLGVEVPSGLLGAGIGVAFYL